MKTKFGRKLINFAKNHKAYNKKDLYIIIYYYLAFSLTLFLIPINVLDKFPFLWQFCKFIAYFVPLVKELIFYQASGNIIFYFSYMIVVTYFAILVYGYRKFFYIFGTDDLFDITNWKLKSNPIDSPIYFTISWLCAIIFFGIFIYIIHIGSILDFSSSPMRGFNKPTFLENILFDNGSLSFLIFFVGFIFVTGSFKFLFFIIRLNFCEKLNIKRLKLKLFLLFCIFIGFIWVLKYYYVI